MKFTVIIFLCIFNAAYAATIFQNQPDNLFIVDDFEDADLEKFPKWWGFDNVELRIAPNNKEEFPTLGERSLKMSGEQNNWYVGGAGTYFGIDTTNYNAIKLLVKGYGPKSAILIVELFDDDNNNYEIEKNPNMNSETLADDKFIHTIKIDWYGWKVVIIPFNKFVDVNLGIGDDKWNPYQIDSSGGLLQMQLVLLAANKEIKPKLNIDIIKIYYQGPMPIKKRSSTNSFELDDEFDDIDNWD